MADKVVGTLVSVRWPISDSMPIAKAVNKVLKLIKEQYGNNKIEVDLILLNKPELEGLSFYADEKQVYLSYIPNRLAKTADFMEIYFCIPTNPTK